MTSRPYFHHSVQQLEAVFEMHKADLFILCGADRIGSPYDPKSVPASSEDRRLLERLGASRWTSGRCGRCGVRCAAGAKSVLIPGPPRPIRRPIKRLHRLRALPSRLDRQRIGRNSCSMPGLPWRSCRQLPTSGPRISLAATGPASCQLPQIHYRGYGAGSRGGNAACTTRLFSDRSEWCRRSPNCWSGTATRVPSGRQPGVAQRWRSSFSTAAEYR